MNLLQQNSLHLINLSEFCEVNPMGGISMPMGLVLQTPSFGVVSNVRRKEHSCVLVNRRRNYIKNAISGTQMESNIVVKEDSEFKSSFDDYLKAMESIRADREKQVQNGSTHGKKSTNVAFRKDVLQDRKLSETVESSYKVDRAKKQFPRESGHGQKSIDIALRKDVSRGRKRGETIESSFDREKKPVQRGSGHGKKSIDIAFGKEVSQSLKRSESVEFSVSADKGKKQVHRGSGHRKESIDVVFGKDVLEDWKHGETVASSIIVDRKQQVQGSGHGKKLIDVSSNKGFKEHSKRDDTVKFNRFKRSDFEEGDEHSKRNERVVDKKMLGGNVQARYSVQSQGSKNGSSKRSDVEATTSASNKIVKKKSMLMEQMSDDNEIETERFLFDSSDVLNDGLDGPRVSQMEMEERIQTLAKRLNEADVDMPQWMFAKTMRSARIRYSDSSILRVIQILGKFGNWQRVLQMIEWLQMHERFQSRKPRYVYTAALDVLGKARRPVEALNLFCLMQRHKTTYPDIVTYRSIAVTLGQAGHMKELFDVIDSMRSMPTNFKIDVLDEWDPRIEPDIVIYNAVLNSCVKRKEWEGAIWVLRKLEEMGEQPSSTTYGLAMEVMLACGKYDLVHEYYKRLLGSSVPNALTYKVLVNTLWREGKPDEAIAVVQDMENQGLLGSASLYYDLARCLCSVGRCEEGLMQVDKICKVASKPLVVTFTGLIQACLTSGNIHDAASIFNHMQKYCSPNSVTYNIMLKAFLGYEMLDEAKELFRKIIQSEDKRRKVKSKIKPDLSTFTMMLDAFVREEKWDDFEYAYVQMLQYGYPFNTKHHLWMVLKASCAGKDETVEITWRHLLRFNRIPPPKLIKERFRLKMESNDLVEAFSSVSCHPSSHQESFSKEAWVKLLQDNEHCFKKEALEHLISEINNFLSKSQSPNIIYQNLLDSCMEFVNMTQ